MWLFRFGERQRMSDQIRSMTLSTVSIHIICDCMSTQDTVLIHILGGRQNNFFREVNDNKVSSVSHPLDHGVACYTSSDFFFFSKSTFAYFFFINWKPTFVSQTSRNIFKHYGAVAKGVLSHFGERPGNDKEYLTKSHWWPFGHIYWTFT